MATGTPDAVFFLFVCFVFIVVVVVVIVVVVVLGETIFLCTFRNLLCRAGWPASASQILD